MLLYNIQRWSIVFWRMRSPLGKNSATWVLMAEVSARLVGWIKLHLGC